MAQKGERPPGAAMLEPKRRLDRRCAAVVVGALLLVAGCGGRSVAGHDGGAGVDAGSDAGDAAHPGFDAGDAGQQADAGVDGPAPVGSPCMMNSECASRQCLTDEIAFTLLQHPVYTHGGYCIYFPCDPARHDSDCGPGAHCFDCLPYGIDMSVCLKTCSSPAECTRQDYVCLGVPAADGGAQVGACVPAGLLTIDGGT